jgi:hypothetical protein
MVTEATVYAGIARHLSAGVGSLEYGDAEAWMVLFPDGSWRWGLPPRGVPSDLAADRAEVPSRWGTFTTTGDALVLARSGSVEAELRPVLDGLAGATGVEWIRVPPIHENGGIVGSFARPDWTDADAPRLALAADGRFEATGRIAAMCGSLLNVLDRGSTARADQWGDDPVFDAGGGTWTTNAYALQLAYDDGRSLQYALLIERNASSIVLGETRLARLG